nr:unnamed protein product [Spirometra erinaceieuropaei]
MCQEPAVDSVSTLAAATFGPTALPIPHKPPSLRPPLPRPLRRQLTLTILLNHHFHPPPPLSLLLLFPILLLLLFLLLLRLLLLLPYCTNHGRSGGRHSRQHHTSMTQQQTPSPQPPSPGVRSRTTPALTATAPSPHTSAWSVTCESIAQRLTNQCLEHQPIPTKLASTAHTALALSRIA